MADLRTLPLIMSCPLSPSTVEAIKARIPQIAIDGPSGSGKSTVAKKLASILAGDYVDTGASYRAMSWWMVKCDIDIEDADALAEHAYTPIIELGVNPEQPRVWVDSHDVSIDIRTPEITAAVSRVAAAPEVRTRLVDLQRSYAQVAATHGHGVVMEGRDIGSVVLPDATLKVWLTADLTARAERRAAQDQSLLGVSQGHDTVAEALAQRDVRDRERTVSPAEMAPDAVVVDATFIDADAVVATVLKLVCGKLGIADV